MSYVIACIGSALCGKQYHPNQFHPFRKSDELPPEMLDDPAEEYHRLKAKEQRDPDNSRREEAVL